MSVTRNVSSLAEGGRMLKRFTTIGLVRIGGAVARTSLENAAGRLVERMPVDTGRHRASVRASVGRPMAFDQGEQPSYPIPGAAEFSAHLRSLRIGKTGFVGAAGPAITRLEFDGHSPQAPSGMFGPTRDEMVQNNAAVVREVLNTELKRSFR